VPTKQERLRNTVLEQRFSNIYVSLEFYYLPAFEAKCFAKKTSVKETLRQKEGFPKL